MISFNDIAYSDYDKLRQYGLQYIQEIGHKYWSDYNVHDPGVTFLEALCFSLVDLGYRTSFPMADLLTPQGEQHPKMEGTVLFPAHEILSFNPTTPLDYRKFVLEHVPGVRNVRITPSSRIANFTKEMKNIEVKGYYRTVIELESDVTSAEIQSLVRRDISGKYVDDFEKNYPIIFSHYVKNQLLKHRNLCEDFLDVEVSTPVPVALCLELELDDNIASKGLSENKLCQQIYDLVSEYVAPHIGYHTISELLEKGKTPEEIYQGTLPRLGFIDVDELVDFDKPMVLHISDVLPLLLGIDGVKGVKHIHFMTREQDSNLIVSDKKYVRLIEKDKHHFVLTPHFHSSHEHTPDVIKNELLLNKNWCQFYANPTEPIATRLPHYNLQKDICTSLPPLNGKYRDNSTYHSFQQLLPQCYHMDTGSKGTLDDPEQQISKLQLKGYFAFFDQLLADYLTQLGNIHSFFSLDEAQDIEPTYFHHHLTEEEISDINMVLQDYKSDYSENDPLALDRKSRLMDHLIARFNDSFADYAAFKFAMGQSYAKELSLKENIEDKKRYLKRYPIISGNRAQAQDYTEDWSISGIESRILSRLGINDLQHNNRLTPNNRKSRRKDCDREFQNNCSDPFEQTFGLHIIEHNMLLPLGYDLPYVNLPITHEDNPEVLVDDPYSFRATVVLPGWIDISQNMSFRTYAENVIREEMPAHVVAKICWIAPDVMLELEDAYKQYLSIMKQRFHPMIDAQWSNTHKDAIEKLANVLNKLVNIYPEFYYDRGDDTAKKVFENHIDGDVVLDFNTLENPSPWKNLFYNKKKI